MSETTPTTTPATTAVTTKPSATVAAPAKKKADLPKVRLRFNGPSGRTTLHITHDPITLDPFGYFPAHEGAKPAIAELLKEKFRFPPEHEHRALHGKPVFSLVNEAGVTLDPVKEGFLSPEDAIVLL